MISLLYKGLSKHLYFNFSVKIYNTYIQKIILGYLSIINVCSTVYTKVLYLHIIVSKSPRYNIRIAAF